jgi:ABC-type polysaccharide/polyol phosphate transport system, ATPase component
MSELQVFAEGVGKKFCRRLRRSMWYGLLDIGAELSGRFQENRGLRKDEFWAVQGVSFKLRGGETLGMIGPNGAGKTTLLRMLNGLIKPDVGRIKIFGKMQALIALGAGFNPILTGRENIYINAAVLGMGKTEIDRRFDEIVEFSGIEEYIDSPLQSYSSGMAVRLGFAVAAHLDPEILLIDEVLAVGDYGFQFRCLNKIGELKRKGTGIILVSHNMHTIMAYTNRVALLNQGKFELFENVNDGINKYKKLFEKNDTGDIQKVCSGNDNIRFQETAIPNRKFKPGDTFNISLTYESKIDYPDVEIDIVIYSSNEHSQHFHATNKAYLRKIDLNRGKHAISISIKNIRINNATATVVFVVWTNRRTEQLFWWRIPMEFEGRNYSTGSNFLEVEFDKEERRNS